MALHDHPPSSSSTESIDSLYSVPGTATSFILSGDGRSFRERRGVTFISFTRPDFGPAIPAKGHLEPRAGSLPRRRKGSSPRPAPAKIVVDANMGAGFF
ncbi:hypothetical protein ARMSODRAFT_961130 [Armillaria solidipes]|uniref:Uncharacterized protein n=1 Tax=Armillaria solidipes TaxID=1076256 RepID=A0A2H3B3H0_9AGAR|nr:hypothetical protein ARMSODRAFT_961130 [Armillaria solidipes]